jgi:hypothetical protein
MSALAPRGRGGNPARGSRGATSSTPNSRGASRGRQAAASRGSTRGVRGGSSGQGLLQQLRTGTVARNGQDAGAAGGRGMQLRSIRDGQRLIEYTGRGAPRGTTTTRGRGRGNLTRSFNTPAANDSPTNSRASSPAPMGSFDATAVSGDVTQRYNQVRPLLLPLG